MTAALCVLLSLLSQDGNGFAWASAGEHPPPSAEVTLALSAEHSVLADRDGEPDWLRSLSPAAMQRPFDEITSLLRDAPLPEPLVDPAIEPIDLVEPFDVDSCEGRSSDLSVLFDGQVDPITGLDDLDLPDREDWLTALDAESLSGLGVPSISSPRRRRYKIPAAYLQFGRVVRTEVRRPGQPSSALGPNHRRQVVKVRPNGRPWEVATGITWREFLNGDSDARPFRDTTLGLRWDLSASSQLNFVWTRSFNDETDDGYPVTRGLRLQTQWEF